MGLVGYGVDAGLLEDLLEREVGVHHEVLRLLVADDGQVALGNGDAHGLAERHHVLLADIQILGYDIVLLAVGIDDLVHL